MLAREVTVQHFCLHVLFLGKPVLAIWLKQSCECCYHFPDEISCFPVLSLGNENDVCFDDVTSLCVNKLMQLFTEMGRRTDDVNGRTIM